MHNSPMRRRRVLLAICAAMAASPRIVAGQRPPIPSIGLLHGESPALFGKFLDIFRQGLREAGFMEGENVFIEYRWAEGRNERLPALAADLVERRVSVIVAPGSTPASLAAKRATSSIPIVTFTAGDPVALGLAASLNKPGGNVTGATSLGRELAPKRLQLLHELVPDAVVMALLVNPSNPALAESTANAAQGAARTLALQLDVVQAAAEDEFETAFATIVQRRASGLVIAVNSSFTARREKLAELALRYMIPAVYQYADFAAAGGVMSYGGNFEGYHTAGLYAGRILKGDNPADLPFQQITRTELIINLKTARALGIQVPGSLLARADDVID